MTTLVWLVVWIMSKTPPLQDWNNWTVALVVCLAVDFIGAINRG